ncbi:DUF2975 domain-containing protein [Maribacter sp. MAR_2009_72]|uniref:DUF2975 domain-containing protein n=1 Tax=Maribacter sp. MAR_2009_72 TaxID=1250050 RepID=UPI00119A6261|nr:DUF2975 domain-containing protein [Maribacter sp. MAR_2009_72]TVZ15838.1 Protein of unknown function (DUF2975) [Maribacter sp. MAR_2009_72]
MKNLIFFLYLLICLWIIGGLVAIFKSSSDLYNLILIENVYGNLTIPICILIAKISISSILTFYLLKFSRVINKLNLENFLSKKNGKSFKTIGRVFLYYSFIRLFINIIEISLGENYQKLIEYNTKGVIEGVVTLLITSLFLLIISKIIDQGYYFKNENDLTI